MAFWKKSDDPWDRKPEKKTQAAWWEQPAPGEEVVPSVEKPVENVEKDVEAVEVCPWCGGEQVALGANDQYIGLCRRNWMRGDLGPDFTPCL